MCSGNQCIELGVEPALWSRHAPLSPPAWFRSQIAPFTSAVHAAANGNVQAAAAALSRVKGDELREWYKAHGQRSGFSRARLRKATALAAPSPRVRFPPAATLDALLTRDGYRCRYCGIEVVPLSVLTEFSRVIGPEHFTATGRGNDSKHGAALAFRATFDHVQPLAFGGANSASNIVTACWSCNFGKRAFSLQQLGLDDPRDRPPLLDAWDGLVRYQSKLRGVRHA